MNSRSSITSHIQPFAGIIPLLAGCILFIASCTSGAAPRAQTITCHTAYRSGTGVPIEAEETIAFEDADAAASAPFDALTFNAAYTTGTSNRERSLRLWVTDNESGVELLRQLYQLPLDTGPTDQFIGGHGFTGLNYAHHPASGAELQYWCTAE